MVKANVDKIIDILREKKTSTPGDLSKILSLSKEDIQQTLDYLAEEGTVKVDKKFTGTKVTLLKDPQTTPMQQIPPPPMPQSTPKPAMPAQQSRLQNVPSPGNLPKPPVPSLQTNQQSTPQPPQFLVGQPAQPDAPPAPSMTGEKKEQQKEPSENFPFLIGEKDQKDQQQVTSSLNLRDERKPEENLTEELSPLDYPRFDMDAPSPDGSTSSISLKPVETYTQELVNKYESFPDVAKTSVDKIEYLMDILEKKFRESEYKDLNVIYKRIYGVFSESEELSPNERNLMAKRINEVYDRIKTIYLVESEY